LPLAIDIPSRGQPGTPELFGHFPLGVVSGHPAFRGPTAEVRKEFEPLLGAALFSEAAANPVQACRAQRMWVETHIAVPDPLRHSVEQLIYRGCI